MKFSVLTLFPEAFTGTFSYSILKRAQAQKLVDVDLINIRNFSSDRHRSVDDHPYGGGVGMVMRVDIIDKAIESTKHKAQSTKFKERIILLDPKGKKFEQKTAQRLSKFEHLILICGHYEGVDERVKKLVDESISIGDYVLTGGEIPAMVLVDSITRLIPGVLKKPEAVKDESFSLHHLSSTVDLPLLEYPQYTKPQTYNKLSVPKILLSGNHKKIAEWRKNKSEQLTNHR